MVYDKKIKAFNDTLEGGGIMKSLGRRKNRHAIGRILQRGADIVEFVPMPYTGPVSAGMRIAGDELLGTGIKNDLMKLGRDVYQKAKVVTSKKNINKAFDKANAVADVIGNEKLKKKLNKANQKTREIQDQIDAYKMIASPPVQGSGFGKTVKRATRTVRKATSKKNIDNLLNKAENLNAIFGNEESSKHLNKAREVHNALAGNGLHLAGNGLALAGQGRKKTKLEMMM